MLCMSFYNTQTTHYLSRMDQAILDHIAEHPRCTVAELLAAPAVQHTEKRTPRGRGTSIIKPARKSLASLAAAGFVVQHDYGTLPTLTVDADRVSQAVRCR